MSIVGRITRLFKADVHSILDLIEDPQSVLAQAVRDMQEGIRQDEVRLAELGKQRESAQKRADDLRRSLGELQKQIELCIKSENHTLARDIIRKRLEQERLVEATNKLATDLTRELEQGNVSLKKRKDKLQEVKEKAALFQAAVPQSGSDGSTEATFAVSDSEVEVAFLAERERLNSKKGTDKATVGGSI